MGKYKRKGKKLKAKKKVTPRIVQLELQFKRRHWKDRHHIRPRSRGGDDSKENVAIVDWELHHKCYHRLFKNMTPEEICIYLTNEWWNGDVTHMRSALADLG